MNVIPQLRRALFISAGNGYWTFDISGGNVIVENIKQVNDVWVRDRYEVDATTGDTLAWNANDPLTELVSLLKNNKTLTDAALAEGQVAIPVAPEPDPEPEPEPEPEPVLDGPEPLRSWWDRRCREVAEQLDFTEIEVQIAGVAGHAKFDVGVNRFRRVCEGIKNFDFPVDGDEVIGIKAYLDISTDADVDAFVDGMHVSQLNRHNILGWVNLMEDFNIDIHKFVNA